MNKRLYIEISLTINALGGLMGNMAKGKTSTKDNLRTLKKEIVSEVKKLLSAQDARVKKLLSAQDARVKKLLVAQDIRNWAKMTELEEKFERHVTKVKSDFIKKIDPILKEVTTAREERPLIENRLEALENIHPEGKHATA